METPDTITISPEKLQAIMLLGLVGVVFLFALGAIVRVWGMKMQRKAGPTGGIDMSALRRMLDSGEISAEEFDQVRGKIAGAPVKKKPVEEPPADGKPTEEPPAAP
jgi:hypothetical protein